MGNYASKLFAGSEQTPESEAEPANMEKYEVRTPTAIRRTLPVDPRSASVGIPRSPIEVNFTPPTLTRRVVSAIPKYLQTKPYLETNFDVVMPQTPKKCFDPRSPNVDQPRTPILVPQTLELNRPTIKINERSPLALDEHEAGRTPIEELRYKILGVDPRSPAADFDRTPILKPRSMTCMKARSHENLARRGSYFQTDLKNNIIPYTARLSYCETTTENSVPEVQVLPDILTSVNKAIDSGRLTEFLGNSVSSGSSRSSSVETISDNGENITVIPNPDHEFPQEFFVPKTNSASSSSIEKISDPDETVPDSRVEVPKSALFKTAVDNVNNVLSMATKIVEKQQKIMESEGKIKVWRDSVSPVIPQIHDIDTLEDMTFTEGIKRTVPMEDIMIEFDDKEVIEGKKGVVNKKIDESKAPKQGSSGRKKKNGNVEVRNFMEERKAFTPDGKIISQASKVRTPLGNRSNNHGHVKNISAKSPQQLLRNKAMASKPHQENTPPRMKNRLNGSQWDPDSTIVI